MHTQNYIISISTLPVLFLCLSSQTILLMNIRHQNSTQNTQTHIFLKDIFPSNRFTVAIMYSTQTSKVNVKCFAIQCILVPSPMAYVNLFLHHLTLCIAPPNISTECVYMWKVIQGNTVESVKPARDVEKD